MTPRELLRRSRVWFAALAGLGLCVLAVGVLAASADDQARIGHAAAMRASGLDTPPPTPVAPTIFRAGWHLLLLGVAGLALHDCAAAIVAALRPDAAPPEDPPPGPRKPPRRV